MVSTTEISGEAKELLEDIKMNFPAGNTIVSQALNLINGKVQIKDTKPKTFIFIGIFDSYVKEYFYIKMIYEKGKWLSIGFLDMLGREVAEIIIDQKDMSILKIKIVFATKIYYDDSLQYKILIQATEFFNKVDKSIRPFSINESEYINF